MSRTRISLVVILTTVMIVSALLAVPHTDVVLVRTAIVSGGTFVQTKLLPGTVGYTTQQVSLSPLTGKTDRIYAVSGQKVKKGDLLVKLDTTLAEQLLTELVAADYQQQRLTDHSKEMAVFLQLQSVDHERMMQELRVQIEASFVRAEMDGVVEAVYVGEKQNIAAGLPLISLHSEEKCIWTAEGSDGIQTGTPVLFLKQFEEIGNGVFNQKQYLSTDSAQPASKYQFVSTGGLALDELSAGESVSVKVIQQEKPDSALIPLAAVSASHEVWVVENNHARPIWVDVSQRNESFVALPAEWSGKRVILLPDLYHLSEGCTVREMDE